jgi:hypothetical protein
VVARNRILFKYRDRNGIHWKYMQLFAKTLDFLWIFGFVFVLRIGGLSLHFVDRVEREVHGEPCGGTD